MRRLIQLLVVYTRLGALSDAAYRANFWLQVLESILGMVTALVTVGVVFSQTDQLGGWVADELLALLGVYFLMLGLLNLVVAPSLSQMMEDMPKGNLDFTLTKPADAQLLVSISQVRVFKLVDVALGAVLLAIALARLSDSVGVGEALAFAVVLAAGGATIYSLWMILATLSFWFIRVENILMIFWNLYWAARWPVSVYPSWMRFLLTALVPVAFAVTVPAEALSGRLTWLTLLGSLAVAAVMLLSSRWLWRRGLRHYSGASA